MDSMAATSPVVIGGVDTHKDLHAAAVVTADGVVLATEFFSTTRAGYRALLRWMRRFGDVRRVGIEGTGYGAGVTRHLIAAGVEVVEVARPDRSDRRLRGKNDTLDAEAAAQAARLAKRVSYSEVQDRQDRSAARAAPDRQTAVKSRRAALQLLRNHIVSAPDEVRDPIRHLTRMQLIRTCAAWRPDPDAFRDPIAATRIALKSLARRIIELNDEIVLLDDLIEPLVREINPALLERHRHRHRERRPAAGHRRRQPPAAALRSRLRDALRRRAAACIIRTDPTPPP